MAEINPPLYLDQDAAYGAAELGLPYRDIMGEGVVGAGDLAVTDGGTLKSSVAAGAAWITGDDDTAAQPCYRVRNDAPVLLQHDAADATNARIDLVVARVKDSTFSGVSKLWELAVIKGTPASSPVAPALPSDAIALAEVTIPAGSGTLGTITDRRTRALVGGGAAQPASRVLDYQQVTSPVSVTGTTFGAGVTVLTSSSITLDGSTPVLVEFYASYVQNSTGGSVMAELLDGATDLGLFWASQIGSGAFHPVKAERRYTPAAGSHQWSVKAFTPSGGTGAAIEAGGGAGSAVPAFLKVSVDI